MTVKKTERQRREEQRGLDDAREFMDDIESIADSDEPPLIEEETQSVENVSPAEEKKAIPSPPPPLPLPRQPVTVNVDRAKQQTSPPVVFVQSQTEMQAMPRLPEIPQGGSLSQIKRITGMSVADMMTAVNTELSREWMRDLSAELGVRWHWAHPSECERLVASGVYAYVDAEDVVFLKVPRDQFNHGGRLVARYGSGVNFLLYTVTDNVLAHRKAMIDSYRHQSSSYQKEMRSGEDIEEVPLDKIGGIKARAHRGGVRRVVGPDGKVHVRDERLWRAQDARGNKLENLDDVNR